MSCSRAIIRIGIIMFSLVLQQRKDMFSLALAVVRQQQQQRHHGMFRNVVVCRGKSTDDNDSLAVMHEQTTLDVGLHESEMEVKKSRFIGYAQNVDSWQQAQDVMQHVRSMHPKCRHACFGFYANNNGGIEQERCSDDGEPTGTAGVPILGAIKGESLANVVCVVVRYFGGIKLGAGGLIRAYGGAARLVLREAPKVILIPKSSIHVKLSSVHVGSIYDVVRRVGGEISDEEYEANGDMTVTATCETKDLARLKESIKDSTKGNAVFLEGR